jgi:hypothetical protein
MGISLRIPGRRLAFVIATIAGLQLIASWMTNAISASPAVEIDRRLAG